MYVLRTPSVLCTESTVYRGKGPASRVDLMNHYYTVSLPLALPSVREKGRKRGNMAVRTELASQSSE